MPKSLDMSELKVPFGLKNGRLYAPGVVKNGLACGCVCPECGARLIANHPESKVDYFSHHAVENCAGGYETALHLAAKQVLLDHKKILVPTIRASATLRDEETKSEATVKKVVSEKLVALDLVLQEIRAFAGVVPDIVAYAGEKLLFVEIAVTHFVDEEKLRRLEALGFPTLEIDLSSVGAMPSLQDVERLVIHTLENRKWLVNSKRQKLEAQARDEAQARLDEKTAAVRKKLAAQKAAYAQYLLLPAEEQVIIELQHVGADDAAVAPFIGHHVKGGNCFSVSPKVWQAAVYATFIHEKKSTEFRLSHVYSYLSMRFRATEPFKDAPKAALYYYLEFLCERGLLERGWENHLYDVIADANGAFTP